MPARSTVRVTLGVALLLLFSPDVSHATQVEIKGVYCSGSPCPQPMELPADFPTRINLRGTRLGRLTRGNAIWRDWPTDLVKVDLGKTSGDGSSRIVVLTASGANQPTSGLQLAFRTVAGRTVTAMAGRTPFEMTARPPPPDLIIESVSIEGGALQPTGFAVRLRNQGDGQARLESNMTTRDPSPGYPYVTSNCYELGSGILDRGGVIGLVDPGASITTSLDLADPDYRFPVGIHTCTFIFVWPDGQDVGEDDTNNDFRFTFTIGKQ